MKRKIKLSQIILDKQNPRFKSRDINEENVADFMVKNKLSKTIDMVKDIIKNGLMPLDNIAVIKENNKYVALDGNRRLLALKIICDNTKIQLPKKIQDILKVNVKKIEERTASFEEIEVYVFHDRQDAKKALERKHTSDFGGASHQDWPTLEKKAFQEEPFAIFLIEQCKEANIDYDDFTELVKYTIWERFFASEFSRMWLGVKFLDKNYSVTNKNQLQERLKAIVRATKDKQINFASVNKKTDKEETIKIINQKYLKDSSFIKDVKDTKKNRKQSKESYLAKCKTYIKNDKVLNLINQIDFLPLKKYKELISCAVRPIIEISLNTYITKVLKKSNGWFVKKENTLKVKLTKVINHMENKDISSQTTLKFWKNQPDNFVLMWNGDLHDSIFSSGNYELEENLKRLSTLLTEVWSRIVLQCEHEKK